MYFFKFGFKKMWKNKVVVLLFLVLCTKDARSSTGTNITSITAFANSSTNLPCDISLPNNHERVTLILWYKEDLGIPIYSLEVGNEGIANAEVWSDEKWFGSRAQFRPDAFPAVLRVHEIRGSDAGLYRCRVDFTEAQTRNTLINLTVIVPPSPVVIFDETGTRRMTFVGPYREGSTMTLICDAFGGIPSPSVTWSRDGRLIDNSYTLLANGTVRNEVTFRHLDRSFLHDEFVCSASNTNLTRPTTATVHLDMNFAPSTINITNKEDQLVVGKKSQIVCKSSGSRPPAHIVWSLNGQRIEGGSETATPDGNTTISVLSFMPKMEDIGMELGCKSINPLIKESSLTDEFSLIIDYAPRVELVLGKSISLSAIYEGSDVYFDCRVSSAPSPLRILWFQNNIQLKHDTAEGVLLANRSLVLQKIDRKRSGGYTCQAVNAVGRGSSQAIYLDVKYIPVCRSKQPVVHGVGKGEMVDVICDVTSNPTNLKFRWTFNNSADFINVPRVRAIKVNDTRSKLTYTPRNNKDYGTLMCTATNEVGAQREPCIFHIILAVAPDPVENCTIINRSSETFHLHCVPGFDGGMEQIFLVAVTERRTSAVRYNATSRQLDLFIPNLRAGSSYVTAVTPINKKGFGKTTHVLVDTLNHPAVELTQAEGAYSSSSSSSSSSSGSDLKPGGSSVIKSGEEEWAVLTGILIGGSSCVFVLVAVSVTVRYCIRRRRGGQQFQTGMPGGEERQILSNNNNHFTSFVTAQEDVGFPPNTTVRKGILKRGVKERRHSNEGGWEAVDSPDIIPPPPLLSPTLSSDLISGDFRGEELPTLLSVDDASGNAGRATFIAKGDSCTLPRRTSKEGLLFDGISEANPSSSSNVAGSTDPLLQIPDELCAVLTLQRSSKNRNNKTPKVKGDSHPLVDSRATPVLKKKRESIV